MKQSFTAVICTLNSQYIHSSLAPWCLLAGVNTYGEEGIDAKVIEGTINEKTEDVAQRIIAESPQAVGLSCAIWNITASLRLVELIKRELPGCIIVLGGPEVAYRAGELLHEQPLVDFILSGEGEKPFALLLNILYHGIGADAANELSNVPGLCFHEGDHIFVSAPYTPCDEPPSPYTPAYFEALKGRIAYLETSRGCPFSCAFCLSGRCGGVRYYDLDRAKAELLLLANSGTQTVKLVDRTFNANRARAYEIFQFIIENYGKAIPQGICFHFEIAGDLLNEDTLKLLASAPVGSMQLEIGLQSFNPQTLTSINRRTDVQRLKNNIRRVTATGNMHIHIDLIAGLPHEGWGSFAESFNTAYALKPHMLQLGFLKLLYGAPMRDNPEQFPCGYSAQPPYEVTETPWLSREELLRLHHAEDALDRLYNSGRFRRTLEYVLNRSGLTPLELFCRFGEYSSRYGTKGTDRMPLDAYTGLVFDYFKGLTGIDKDALRDAMVCDRIASNRSGILPAVLRTKDQRFKPAMEKLKKDEATRPQKGVRRGSALLSTENCIVYADYQNKNPVTGEFELKKIPLSAL